MNRTVKVFITSCLLMLITGVSNAQKIAVWKGGKVPATTAMQAGETNQRDTALYVSIELALMQDSSWNIKYAIGETSGDNPGLNETTKPLSLLFKVGFFDTSSIIAGTILPDSSKINCRITSNKMAPISLVLDRIAAPVFWSGDTTVNGKKTMLRITRHDNNSWEVFLQGDDIGTLQTETDNAQQLPGILLSLATTFDEIDDNRRFEGKISPDSLTVSGIAFLNDSVSLPITLYKYKRVTDEGGAEIFSPALWNGAGVWWWAGTWIAFIIVMLLVFWLQKRPVARLVNTTAEMADDALLSKILPIVRISCKRYFFGKKKVMIIYPGLIVFFYAGRKLNKIEPLHEPGSENLPDSIDGLSRLKKIPFDAITKAAVEKESRLGKVRFCIMHNNKKEKFVLPGYEMPNVLKAFELFAGNRLQTGLPIGFHQPGVWIQLFLLSFAAVYLYAGFHRTDLGLWVILYVLAFMVILIYALYLLFSTCTWFLDHLPRRFNKPVNKQAKADLSQRRPFRSVPLSILLKIIGAAVLLATFMLLKKRYLPDFLSTRMEMLGEMLGPFVIGFLGVFGYLLTGLILNLSLAFANRNPRAVRSDDTRRPVLYLRSFLDDRETTFQPGTWWSNFLGVDPPYYQLSKYMFNSSSVYYRFNKKIFKYLYNNHPVRMLRLLFGWPVDTSEQQLELHFRKKGPFVAIGRPGERIITSGASRMYVGNDEWQNVILDYLQRSQLVVLQPGNTEGIWWEIEQALKITAPDCLFLCMVNYKGHQNFYEDFRQRIQSLDAGIKLPPFIGNAKEICFVGFNENREPKLFRLQYKKIIYWPFQGNAADIERSLDLVN